MQTTDIDALRTEAGAAGDLDLIDTCDRALAGDDRARTECVDIIEAHAAEVSWQESMTVAVADHTAAQATSDEAEARRDDAIRAALADGTRVADLVRVTGLSRTRIYQIRDRTR